MVQRPQPLPVHTVHCPQPLQVIHWSRSPAEAKGPTPVASVRPKIGSLKMPEISILTPLLFFIGANASEPYEEAMTRQIEDDVLRKFYIDMNPGHILYEPQSVSWVYHHSKLLLVCGSRGSTSRTTLTRTPRRSHKKSWKQESTCLGSRPSRSRRFSRFSHVCRQ